MAIRLQKVRESKIINFIRSSLCTIINSDK